MAIQERQNHEAREGSWEACPAGELTHLVNRLDAQQRFARKKQVLGTAAISTMAFASVVLAVGMIMGPDRGNYGNINCEYCRSHMAEYYPHAIGQVALEDAEFVASMKVHIEKCTLCRSKFNGMYPDAAVTSLDSTRRAMLIAMQPSFALGQSPRF